MLDTVDECPESENSLINDRLYLSGYSTALTVTPDTIQTVVSIIGFPFPDKYKKPGIEYLQIIANDEEEEVLLTHFPQTNRWIGDSINAKRSVLVHCQAGVSRSATIVCAYIMQKLNKNAEEAIAFVRSRRRWVSPNHGFVAQLELFYRMGYTLNANERLLRNFLVEIHFGIDKNIELIDKYFERLTAIERQTKVLELGREYRCQKCSSTTFHEINIVRNIDAKDKGQCPDIYIEPLEWMKDQIQRIPLFSYEGITGTFCSDIIGH